jgi:hypothetical protein
MKSKFNLAWRKREREKEKEVEMEIEKERDVEEDKLMMKMNMRSWRILQDMEIDHILDLNLLFHILHSLLLLSRC